MPRTNGQCRICHLDSIFKYYPSCSLQSCTTHEMEEAVASPHVHASSFLRACMFVLVKLPNNLANTAVHSPRPTDMSFTQTASTHLPTSSCSVQSLRPRALGAMHRVSSFGEFIEGDSGSSDHDGMDEHDGMLELGQGDDHSCAPPASTQSDGA